MMDMSWDDLRLFLAAWEQGSLTGAAGALGLGQATLSRRMAALEEQVGHVLFDRTRGGLVPTAAARTLHPHVLAMAEAARSAHAAMQGLEAEPEGVVRVAVPPGIAVDVLPPLLPALRRRFPRLRLEILADTATRDLARHEADIALRSFPPDSGDLLVRRLVEVPLRILASPAYIASLPPQPKVEDLDWITWTDDLAHIPMARWIEDRLQGRPPVLRTNDFLCLRAAAVQGLGCVLIPAFQGELVGLVEVPVPRPDLPPAPGYLVVHRALRHVPRVAAVVDFLVEEALSAQRQGPP